MCIRSRFSQMSHGFNNVHMEPHLCQEFSSEATSQPLWVWLVTAMGHHSCFFGSPPAVTTPWQLVRTTRSRRLAGLCERETADSP